MPRISVIIPAYNSADVLAETLATVKAQSYGDWEVRVGDDASTDGTAELVEELGDPRIKVVRAATNGGPAHARNVALREATGELVAFLDADDGWLPAYLEQQVARYDAERGRPGAPVGLVACDAEIRSDDGTRLPGTYLEQFRRPVEPLTLERVLRRNCVYVSALVPREAGEEVGWFDEALFGTEDHDLWIRILETGRRAVLNRAVLAFYRRREGSVSSNIARMARNNQRTYASALSRGRLGPREQRIARRELRYNRAMEAVAAAWFERRPGGLVRAAPVAVGVAVSRPGHWLDWAGALRRS